MNARWLAVYAWTGLVVVLMLLPGRAVPSTDIPHADKVVHFGVYGVLALLAHRAARWPCLACGLVVTAACGALGALIELTQAFIPGRSASVADGLVNVAGAAVASYVMVRWQGRESSRGTAAAEGRDST